MPGGPYQFLQLPVTEQQLECVSANILCSGQSSSQGVVGKGKEGALESFQHLASLSRRGRLFHDPCVNQNLVVRDIEPYSRRPNLDFLWFLCLIDMCCTDPFKEGEVRAEIFFAWDRKSWSGKGLNTDCFRFWQWYKCKQRDSHDGRGLAPCKYV